MKDRNDRVPNERTKRIRAILCGPNGGQYLADQKKGGGQHRRKSSRERRGPTFNRLRLFSFFFFMKKDLWLCIFLLCFCSIRKKSYRRARLSRPAAPFRRRRRREGATRKKKEKRFPIGFCFWFVCLFVCFGRRLFSFSSSSPESKNGRGQR